MLPTENARQGGGPSIKDRLTQSPWVVGLALTSAVTAYTLVTQPHIASNDGMGWDGEMYVKMVEGTPGVPPPWSLRIAFPLLVRALSPFASTIDGLRFWAIIFGFLFALLSYVLLARLYPTPRLLAIGGFLVLNLSELSPIRMAVWNGANTDIPANLLFVATLWLLLLTPRRRLRDVGLFFAFLLGCTTRENFVVNLALVCVVELVRWDADSIKVELSAARLISCAAALAGAAAGALLVGAYTGRSIFKGKSNVMMEWVAQVNLISIVTALVLVYGFVILLLPAVRGLRTGWSSRETGLLAFLLLTIPIAVVGGGNTERFLYWYQPLIVLLALPLAAALLAERRYLALALAFLWVAVFQRFAVPLDPVGPGVAMDSSCALPAFVRGGSPHLLHYVYLCKPKDCVSFLGVFAALFAIILASRLRLRLVRGPST